MAFTEKEKQLMIEARREYQRKWRQQNPEKVKAAQERHWLKKAQELLKSQERSNGQSC